MKRNHALIALLAMLMTLPGCSRIERAQEGASAAKLMRAEQDIRSLGTALMMYQMDNSGALPSTAQGLQALVTQPEGDPAASNWRSGGYIRELPADPWGNPYRYQQPGTNADFDVWSAGPDGTSGTADDIFAQ